MKKLGVWLACISFGLQPISANAIDLMQAYDAALRNDPEFRAALKENEAGQANRRIGRAALLPQASASFYQAATNSQITGPAFLNGPGVTTNRSYTADNAVAQIRQPLFDLEALAKYRYGNAQADLSDARFVYRSQDLLVRVLQAYVDLLFAQDQLGFVSAERDAKLEQLKANERMFKLGEGTKTDTLETLASYEMSEAQVIEVQNSLEVAKRKLESITGTPITSMKEVKKLNAQFILQPLIPNVYDMWKDTAMASSPEIRASSHNIEVARQEYQRAVSGHSPSLAGVASWNQQKGFTVSTINQNTNTTAIGLQLMIPIFSGGEVSARSSQSRANLEKAQAEYDATLNRVTLELQKQYDAVVSSNKKIMALNRAVESATELTKAMRKSVQGGQRINLDVLIADKGLATAQRDLAKSKYEYLLAMLKLKQQAGVLTIEDLEKVAINFGAKSIEQYKLDSAIK